MKRAYFLIVLAALPACDLVSRPGAPVQPPPVPAPAPPDPANDTCGAGRFAGLMNQPEDQVTTLNFDQPARIIGPGDPMTLDFNPGRINFEIDGAGKVGRIYCG